MIECAIPEQTTANNIARPFRTHLFHQLGQNHHVLLVHLFGMLHLGVLPFSPQPAKGNRHRLDKLVENKHRV